jgi:hypothetical protein
MTDNILHAAISPELIAHGFRRHRQAWYRSTREVVQVFNLQKSQWGEQYYMNLGLWLKELGGLATPPESKCHIRIRATELPRAKAIARLLDLDKDVPSVERSNALRAALVAHVFPFFDACSSLDGIVQLREKLAPYVVSDAADLLRRRAKPRKRKPQSPVPD